MKNNQLIGPSIHFTESFIISDYFKKNNETILYIGKDEREITIVFEKLRWLLPKVDIYIYKSWDQIPYDQVSPSKEIQLERLKTLFSLKLNKNKKIILTTLNSVIQKTIPKNVIEKNSFKIYIGLKINFTDIINKLRHIGYERVSLVRDKSEFAIRGSILDIFISNHKNPIRIDFLNNIIESIYNFDSISQKRFGKIINKKLLLNSSSELIVNSENIEIFRSNFRKIFPDYRKSQIYNLFSELIIPSGGEQFLPLFYTKLDSIFDYIENSSIFLNNDFKKILENRIENINDYYLSRKSSDDHFYLKPSYLYLNKIQLNNYFKGKKIFNFTLFKNNNQIISNIKTIHKLSSIKKEVDFKLINKFFELNSKNKKIIVCCRSLGTLDRINRIFKENIYLFFEIIKNNNELKNGNLFITVLNIEESFEFNNIIYINEKSIFGYFFNIKRKKTLNTDLLFEELNKLSKNSILVHSEYGICKFNDLKKIDFNESIHDCLELEFADSQKLYLPIENLNYVTRYGNFDDTNYNLDKLGLSNWQKRKLEAKNKIKNAAKKLIKIASKRLQSQSYNINTKHHDFDKFCSTFPYVETDDQLNAIQDVLDDFDKNIPSDRLIVGDVAYGKTEVIIRAIFLAAKSNLQSIVLVPTTILARQHYENFSKRLNIFGIKIAELSRLVSLKNKKKIYEECQDGSVKVLIGTHALLSDKLKFSKLGLIIYDEEQKLGTLQKEKFKDIAPKAHVISLSATPIPRTLSMALSGIRDLSLILTAPFERLAVRTYISPFDEFTIIEAIKREIYGRKNGVYFVTPRKKDIPFIEKFLNEKLNKIKYVVAHGQLSPKLLEERISKFYNQEVPLMVSTNIIENGLDLPHVNTIIVYRSNIFSLASLYQLKGRVGRSSKRGYAYITFKENELKDNGKKRLSIINSSNELGAGFNIASQDLDMRGGGSIIGEEQSGFIREIGTELYHQMLEEEIKYQKQKLSNNHSSIKNSFQPNIKLPEEIFIPDEYIEDVNLRLSIYKRISNIKNNHEINDFLVELHDRFGKIPKQVKNLFKLIELKILCINSNIDQLEFNRKGIVISFYKNVPNNAEKLIDITLSKKNKFYLRPDQKLFYPFDGKLEIDRFLLAKKIINKLN